jgi:hypothetical protein
VAQFWGANAALIGFDLLLDRYCKLGSKKKYMTPKCKKVWGEEEGYCMFIHLGKRL